METTPQNPIKELDGHQFMSLAGGYVAFPASQVAGFPKDIGGVPCFYYFKDVIAPGTFPGWSWNSSGQKVTDPLTATPELIEQWKSKGDQMLSDGVPIPIVCDHDLSAKQVLGNVVGFKLDPTNHTLYELCQFIGEDARDVAMRNKVSIGRNKRYVDANGKNWGDCLVHLGVVPIPAFQDQGPYLQAASRASTDAARADATTNASASESQTNRSHPMDSIPATEENMSALRGHAHLQMKDVPNEKAVEHLSKFHTAHAQHLSQMCSFFPGGSNCPPEEVMPRAVQHLSTLKDVSKKLGISHMSAGPEGTAQLMSIIDGMATSKATIETKDNEIRSRDSQIQNLSARVVKDLDPDSEELVVGSLSSQFDGLLNCGIAPHVITALKKLVIHDGKKGNTIMLSKASAFGNKAPALALLEILQTQAGYVAPKNGELSPHQTQLLSRQVPDQTGPTAEETAAAGKILDSAMGIKPAAA
jgi:hypothetical protein